MRVASFRLEPHSSIREIDEVIHFQEQIVVCGTVHGVYDLCDAWRVLGKYLHHVTHICSFKDTAFRTLL
jgi:hypothetical protein